MLIVNPPERAESVSSEASAFLSLVGVLGYGGVTSQEGFSNSKQTSTISHLHDSNGNILQKC